MEEGYILIILLSAMSERKLVLRSPCVVYEQNLLFIQILVDSLPL